MTCRELIIYILQNNLEDEPVIKNGSFVGFLNEVQVAEKFGVGVETVRIWAKLNMIPHANVDHRWLIPANVESPLEKDK